MGAPRIDQINLVVDDVDAFAQFLARLGIELPAAPPGWDARHRTIPTATSLSGSQDQVEPAFGIDLDSGDFAHQWGGLDPSFTGVVVNLKVDERTEVDRLHELAISVGGRSVRPPYDAFWGSRFALVEAPGPVAVGIMSVPDEARRTAPPEPSDFS